MFSRAGKSTTNAYLAFQQKDSSPVMSPKGNGLNLDDDDDDMDNMGDD